MGNKINEIIFVSLANTMLFETYEIKDMESLEEAYKLFNEVLDKHGYHDTDIELQVGSSEIGLNDRNVDCLKDFYEIQEETQEDLKVIVSLYDYYNSIEDVRSVIDNRNYGIYEGNDDLDAFIGYVEEIELLDRLPEDLKGYFDYEKYYRDCQYNGMTVIEIDKYSQYMFVF